MKTNEKQMKIWEIWKYALGSFSDDKTAPYDDFITIVRTVIFVSILTTNTVIVAGVVRHWDDNTRNPDKCHLLEKQL
jgi:hypothetical protein